MRLSFTALLSKLDRRDTFFAQQKYRTDFTLLVLVILPRIFLGGTKNRPTTIYVFDWLYS